MRQGVDIGEVEVATKIRAKYLRALENDEFALLPGSTYVRSFLRTYAEYLGLDAQLLVEEYRAQHEPRVELEAHPLAPPARPGRDRRPAAAPIAIGPGTLAVGAILFVLVLLAVIGLASGGNGGKKKGGGTTAAQTQKQKQQRREKRKKERAPAVPRTLRLKVIPAETTYLCLDDGKGTILFEGTISTPQSFREKRMRILLGRSSASLYVNGKRLRFPQTADVVSYSFSRTGHATPLPPGQRPCAA